MAAQRPRYLLARRFVNDILCSIVFINILVLLFSTDKVM